MTKSEKRAEQMAAFSRLLDVMDELREKCPWDREQTIESLRTLTIEETFELSDAIMQNDMPNICKELGDILLHIVFYSKIAEENGQFDIVEVIDKLCSKLIYRHPHVYSTTEVENAGQVVQNWEALKTKEKDGNKTILSGVPQSMPSMIKAYRMQDKARAVGFDWDKKEDVWNKVKEEIAELEVEMNGMDAVSRSNDATQEQKDEAFAKAQSELGDLFFSLVNAARLYKLEPDTALESTNKKFRNRFTYLEEQTIRKGRSLKDMTLEEMDAIWDEAKRKGL
ncbi:MAG: nucleoside triphosphate pyrophosphohydrolase [Bacteroidales bacterium]|nr:nucleoside triphosphate pyrophosphohydrolase [Bacteroidales bacterium]